MTKKIILCFILLILSLPRLFSQTAIEKLFSTSFDVDYETAIGYRKKIIETSPGSKYAMYCDGWFKTKNDSSSAALIIANDLLKKYPDFVYGYLLRGNANYYLTNYIEAIKDYNIVIERIPSENGGYYNRGLCKFKLEDYRGAILDYDKAIENNPKIAETYYRRGLVKIKINLIDEGCLDLSKAGELGFYTAYPEIRKYCK